MGQMFQRYRATDLDRLAIESKPVKVVHERGHRPAYESRRTTFSAACKRDKHDKCTAVDCQCDCGHGEDE